MDLTVHEVRVGDRAVLTLRGEIDLATVPQLHHALVRHIVDHAEHDTIVDLDGVYVCDDSGLGVLLGAAGRAREQGGDLVVVCSAGSLRDRLARTGFDRAVRVVASVTAAVAGPE